MPNPQRTQVRYCFLHHGHLHLYMLQGPACFRPGLKGAHRPSHRSCESRRCVDDAAACWQKCMHEQACMHACMHARMHIYMRDIRDMRDPCCHAEALGHPAEQADEPLQQSRMHLHPDACRLERRAHSIARTHIHATHIEIPRSCVHTSTSACYSCN